MRELYIDGTRIADDTDAWVIAEIGHNHQGSVELCKKMFDAAKWAGCNAVKLQKRDNKTLYSEEFYNAPYNSENAFGRTYGEHREALEFNREQYSLLKCYAESLGLTFFATAFDRPSVDFLVQLGIPAIKLASGDIGNKPLLEAASASGKPVILSAGGSGWEQIENASGLLNGPHAILQCTSGYPAKYEELNLRVIPQLRLANPDTVIGFSDHCTGIAMAPVAYALGARILEKHFTLDRSMKGTDQSMSLEPGAMKKMIENLRLCKLALGDGIKRCYESEKEPLKKQWKDANGRITGSVVPTAL